MLLLALTAALAADPGPVHMTVDAFHRAAATANEDAYFDLLAEDAVFVGTDATERWDKEAFRAFAAPHFEGEEAWTYVSVERHVTVEGKVAWFDERLEHARYGEVRGSGVLRKRRGNWEIVQYVLSFPVPNEVAVEVVELVKGVED